MNMFFYTTVKCNTHTSPVLVLVEALSSFRDLYLQTAINVHSISQYYITRNVFAKTGSQLKSFCSNIKNGHNIQIV